ncbi:MAG: DEAD/DEAH box helicase [Cryomorphaceae bacterium]
MDNFNESGLSPEILEAVAKLGFDTPTPIQARTIPLIHEPPCDMIALAQTGTGKTAAFGLPLLHRLETDRNDVQALILCPTRELCLQIVNDINDFSRFMKGVKITAVYGGASIDTQIRALRKGTQIVVGTPGRVVDMISRGELRLKGLDFFVLDEADEMLNMGFKEDLETIFEATTSSKNTWLFSATMPSRVESIAGKFMDKPIKITVGKRNEGASNIEHVYYMVQARDRFEALTRIVASAEDVYGVVFCRTRTETTDIAEKLSRKGYNAQALNGEMSQQQRDKVMGAFRKGHVKLLVATDVAARGLDVEELTHVINYNVPDDPEVYVHRSGRTGRAGKSGISASIIHSREQNRIRDLERVSGKKFEHKKVPLLTEITKYNVLAMADKLMESKGNIGKMGDVPVAVALKFEDLSREDLIELWIKAAYAAQSQEPGMPDDINVDKNSKGGRTREPRSGGDDRYSKGSKRERSGGGGRDEAGAFTEVEINLGREQYIKPNKIMGIINDLTGNSSINFGRIDIHDSKTFVGVESAHAREVAQVLDGLQFGSIRVKADVKSGGGDRPRSGGGFDGKKKYGGFKKKEFGAKSKGGYNKGGKNPSGKFKKKR